MRYVLLFATCLPLAALAQTGIIPNREVLMTSVRTGDTEVFAFHPVTGDARNLSRSPASEDRYANWSADGRYVVFTSNRQAGGRSGTAFNVFVMDANGGNVRQITRETGVCYYPNFTADDRQIVFSYADDPAGIAQLIRINVDGTGRTVIGNGRDGHVSADGKRVVFTKRAEKGFPLYVVDIDGRNERQLNADHDNSMGAVGPVFSPDGKQILYVDQVKADGTDALEIFVCNADGSAPRQLTRLGQMATSPAWSPDGRWISFRLTDNAFWRDAAVRDKTYQEKRADKRPVYMMPLDGATAPQLIEPMRFQCAIDGSRANFRPTK